jgi:hypothetical protein
MAGLTTRRGYGAAHQRLRRALSVVVASGSASCTRCGQVIEPNEPWDLDHRDDRLGYNGAAHRSCNRSAGARRKQQLRSAEARAIAWAKQYEADMARLERERRAAPKPAIY